MGLDERLKISIIKPLIWFLQHSLWYIRIFMVTGTMWTKNKEVAIVEEEVEEPKRSEYCSNFTASQ